MNRTVAASVAALASAGLILSFALVSGCVIAGRSIKTANFGSANQIMIYQDGRLILERSIAVGSDEDKAVASWLRSHEEGWRPDLASYAPGRQVCGENFRLNFHKNRCILNYQTNKKGDWSQVSRPMTQAETIPEVFTPPR